MNGYEVPWIDVDVLDCGKVDQLAIKSKDVGQAGAAQLERGGRDRFKHGLHIPRRLADHPQDFARCRLLFIGVCEAPLESNNCGSWAPPLVLSLGGLPDYDRRRRRLRTSTHQPPIAWLCRSARGRQARR